MIFAAVIGIALLSIVSGEDVTGNVAFTAGITTEAKINKGTIVSFNSVFTNHGSGYNSATGVFTVPKGGLYAFFVSAVTQEKNEFFFGIYKNDAYQISVFAQGRDIGSGGNTILLRLFKNDRVYVKAHRNSYVQGQANDISATFSGLLVGLLTA